MGKTVTVSFHNTPHSVQCVQNDFTDIRGYLIIDAYDVVQVVGIRVDLNGECRSNPLPTADVPHAAWAVNPYAWEISVNNLRARDGQRVHAGSCEESRIAILLNGNRRRPWKFQYSFRLSFEQPVPESWRGNKGRNASVTYKLGAQVRYIRALTCTPYGPDTWSETVETVTGTQSITLCNSFSLAILDDKPYLPSNIGGTLTRVGGYFGGRGSDLYCSVRLLYGGFVRGEYIPALVYICNKSDRTIPSVTLHFLQVFTIKSRKCPDDDLEVTECCRSFRMERVAPRSVWNRLVLGLKVPENSRTSGSFPANPLTSVRFLVRLKLQYRWCNTMTCDVACHVGTERSSSDRPVPKAIINEERLPLFPPDFRDTVKEVDLPFTILEPADS